MTNSAMQEMYLDQIEYNIQAAAIFVLDYCTIFNKEVPNKLETNADVYEAFSHIIGVTVSDILFKRVEASKLILLRQLSSAPIPLKFLLEEALTAGEKTGPLSEQEIQELRSLSEIIWGEKKAEINTILMSEKATETYQNYMALLVRFYNNYN